MTCMSDFTFHLITLMLLAISISWCEVAGLNTGNCSACKVPMHFGHDEILEPLKPLCGLRFSTQDGNKEYEYNVGICVVGEAGETSQSLKTAGAIQTDLKRADTTVKTMIGNFEKTEVMFGKNWIYLEYEGGISYGKHCANEERRTVVMITCAPDETKGNLRWMEENRNKSGDCYYLFELEHSAACSSSSSDNSRLSSGSLICIILACLVGAYLVFGVLFMRFVKGAKGLNQIPNYDFWRDFGSLQADGCDLICRCAGNRYAEAKPYHGIGDHQIENANDGEDLDEHLLPM